MSKEGGYKAIAFALLHLYRPDTNDLLESTLVLNWVGCARKIYTKFKIHFTIYLKYM